MATNRPDEATAMTAPSGSDCVRSAPRTTVRPGGTRTSRAGTLATGPFGPDSHTRISAVVLPGLASETFQIPLEETVPAWIAHAVAGVPPTTASWSPCAPEVRLATAAPG